MRKLLTTIGALCLAACVTTPVTQLDTGNYMVSIHTWLGWTSRTILTNQATDEAIRYCNQQGKFAHVVNSADAGLPGLTNLSSTVVFKCEVPERP